MNDKFDELAKGLARTTTRRQALKKFGVGLTGVALACFGLANRAKADKGGCKKSGAPCKSGSECCSGFCSIPFKYNHGTCF
jgi:hypothetical protein